MTTFNLNGRAVSVHSPDDAPLLWVIRDELGLTGTKFGFGIGFCGACTVHVEGRSTRSCITSVGSIAGAEVTTIEGLDPAGKHPLQTAWIELQVPQCGYCQSGQIMQAATLLKDYPNPTDQDINAVMAGSLCRCMTYIRIRKRSNWRRRGCEKERHLHSSSAHDTRGSYQPSRRGFLIAMAGLLDGAGRNAGSAPNSVGGAKRQAAVLARVAQKANWGSIVPHDVGLGVASSFGQERDMPTWCACVARVRVDRSSGQVTVEKLTLVVDAGTIIHPDGAAAQVEGSALWGLSMALYEGTEFVMGQPKDTNLDTYAMLRMGNVPEVEIEFMPSTEAPVGLGEPATAVIAPAIGNAIFAALGARLRHLPIRPENIRQALAHRS